MEKKVAIEKKLVIIPTKKLDTIDFSKLSITKKGIIYNRTKTKFMVKYARNCPDFLINEFHVSKKEFKAMLKDKNSSWYTKPPSDKEFILLSTWKTIKRIWKRNNPFKR